MTGNNQSIRRQSNSNTQSDSPATTRFWEALSPILQHWMQSPSVTGSYGVTPSSVSEARGLSNASLSGGLNSIFSPQQGLELWERSPGGLANSNIKSPVAAALDQSPLELISRFSPCGIDAAGWDPLDNALMNFSEEEGEPEEYLSSSYAEMQKRCTNAIEDAADEFTVLSDGSTSDDARSVRSDDSMITGYSGSSTGSEASSMIFRNLREQSHDSGSITSAESSDNESSIFRTTRSGRNPKERKIFSPEQGRSTKKRKLAPETQNHGNEIKRITIR